MMFYLGEEFIMRKNNRDVKLEEKVTLKYLYHVISKRYIESIMGSGI